MPPLITHSTSVAGPEESKPASRHGLLTEQSGEKGLRPFGHRYVYPGENRIMKEVKRCS
jgi:hypothetical protein